MPRKKVNPVEEPEQVNDTELESQVTEDAVEGLEQPPADVPPERSEEHTSELQSQR